MLQSYNDLCDIFNICNVFSENAYVFHEFVNEGLLFSLSFFAFGASDVSCHSFCNFVRFSMFGFISNK